MQKKKVLLITYGNRDHASTRIRALNHFDRLKGEFEVTWIPRVVPSHGPNILSKIAVALSKKIQAVRLTIAVLFGRFDIVFVQVIFLPGWCLARLKNRGALICYDFDDAVYTYSKGSFELMMKYSDKIIVATPYLSEHVRSYNKSCRVIFSPVDTNLIVPVKKADRTFTIGWVGSTWTLPYLLTLQPVFKALSEKMTYKLLVQGAQISIPGVNSECIPWSEQNEIDTLARIDVGIMPLLDDEWSRMKGGYKLFLYMAAGKPTIASPFGINAEIVKNEVTGFLATQESDWIAAFERLKNNPDMSENMGANARLSAEQSYSYNVCTRQLFDFLNN